MTFGLLKLSHAKLIIKPLWGAEREQLIISFAIEHSVSAAFYYAYIHLTTSIQQAVFSLQIIQLILILDQNTLSQDKLYGYLKALVRKY